MSQTTNGATLPPWHPGFDHAGLRQRLVAGQQHAEALFDKTSKARKDIGVLQSGLAKLMKLGDLVTPEDVIEQAGKLVAKGFEPMILAGYLADMPEAGGGEALAGWVAQHVQTADQNAQQIDQLHQQARHQLGTSSLSVLQAHSGPASGPAQTIAGAGAGANSLMPESAGEAPINAA